MSESPTTGNGHWVRPQRGIVFRQDTLYACGTHRVSVSAWMTTAAREALQRRAGLAGVGLWEKQQGLFTPEEMTEARRSVRAQFRTPRTIRRPA